MTIKELISTNINKGFKLRDAQNLAAEEIIIRKIASSEMAEHITLKGGIVMYNLTKNSRRVTQDIDFDLIRYSIDEESIRLLISKMNRVDDDFALSISGKIESLKQKDYQGVRIHIVIKDRNNYSLKTKLDIGVHTYSAIEQNAILFDFGSNDKGITIKANPPEQIFSEKLISLARLGVISTRYKDIYDFYYLIKECRISSNKVRDILAMFLNNSNRKPNSMLELQTAIEDTLNNQRYIKEASKPASKWIDEDFDVIRKTIIDFVNKL